METESRYKKLINESCFHLHKILDSVTLENSVELARFNLYTFQPKEGESPAQGLLSAVVSSPQYPNGVMQLLLSYLFVGANKDATTLPTGEFPFYNMYKDGEATGDCVTASDYYVYLNMGGGNLFVSEIYTFTAAGGLANIFYPQTGTLKIEAGTTEGSMKFTINATSFNGSTFQGTFELPEYVEQPTSAPQRLAPKADPAWKTYLFKQVRHFDVPQKRVMR